MSDWSQSFTFTKNVAWDSILCSSTPTQWTVWQPIQWRCLFSILGPVRRPVTTLDYVLLNNRNLALAPRQGPKINSRACLWVLPWLRHHTQCWLLNQCLILLLKSCLENPKASSGPTNLTAEPPLASSSAISLPRTPACPRTQYNPTACQVEIKFNAFWHCWTNGDFHGFLKFFLPPLLTYWTNSALNFSFSSVNCFVNVSDNILLLFSTCSTNLEF
jgi:hypothetical protein